MLAYWGSVTKLGAVAARAVGEVRAFAREKRVDSAAESHHVGSSGRLPGSLHAKQCRAYAVRSHECGSLPTLAAARAVVII